MQQQSFDITILGEKFRGHYIKEANAAIRSLAVLQSKDVLFGIDTETEALPQYKSYPDAALSPHLSQIRLIQVFDGANAFVFDLKFIDLKTIFIPFLESKRFIGHNSVFDLQFFKMMGVKKMNIGCTMLLAKLLIHATRPTDIRVGLKPLAEHVLKVEVRKEVQVSDWSVPELTFEQIEYAALDAVTVVKIAEKLAPGLKKFGLERVYKLYKAAQHPIAQMQLNGLNIDTALHQKNIDIWRQDLYAAKKAVLALTGLTSLTAHTLADWLEKNLDKETLAIWPVTDTGKLATDAHVFADFSWLPIVEPFSKYQKLEKLTSSFGHNLLKEINPATKKIHASYRLCGARTGRMSCSQPNLQQFPRNKEFRKIFIPSVSYSGNRKFVCADFSQIELRVAAELSRDEVMLKAYREGVDLHALTASRVLKKHINSVTKDDRQMAKAFNFGLMFGLGAKKFSHYAKKSYGVEVTQDEAIQSIEIFRETYSGYREWQMAQANKAEVSLKAVTPCGKLRRLPDDNTFGNSMNHPVQGGAAEVMLYALIRFHAYIEENQVNWELVNCVHDEILVECWEHEEQFCAGVLNACMTQAYLDVFPNGITNGLVEAHAGNSWGESK